MRSISIIHVCVVLCLVFSFFFVYFCLLCNTVTFKAGQQEYARLNENATINAEIFRACQKGTFCQKNNAIPHAHTHKNAHTHTPWYTAYLSYETRTHMHTHKHTKSKSVRQGGGDINVC